MTENQLDAIYQPQNTIDFVIVAYNNFDYIDLLIQSIYRNFVNFKITVVNNGNNNLYKKLGTLRIDCLLQHDLPPSSDFIDCK